MNRITRRGRGRAAASVAVTIALCGSTAALTSGAAQSVPPTGDCAQPFPVSQVVKGQSVEGLTVETGTAADPFTGSVIGVLHDGIAPGLDMVMMELDSPAIQRAGGIWQGMSGSPVYDQASGDLIGAVAYGLTWGSSPIAGITPFEEMDDYIGGPVAARAIEIGPRTARTIARSSDVTREQAAEGFSQLPMPLGISGVRQSRLDKVADGAKPRYEFLTRNARRMGVVSTAATDAPGAETMTAGGNLGVTVSYGDVTAGGVGTVTSVCEDRVVGFGHPAYFSGRTSMMLHPADALYVQPDTLGAGFKVANMAAPVGTITNDRLSGVSGVFDVLPATMDLSSTVTFETRSRTGTTEVSLPDAAAEMTLWQQIVNHDRVIDGYTAGSELQEWTITGDDNGEDFTISHTDRYASDYDISWESPWDVADIVWSLSSLQGVTVESVDVGAAVVEDSSTWRITKLLTRRGGEWVKVSRRSPVVARAGRTLALRAELEGTAGTRTEKILLAIPRRAAGMEGELQVVGGGSMWDYPDANTVAKVKSFVDSMTRNDAIEAQLRLGRARNGIKKTVVTEPADKVVHGGKYASVLVRR